MLDVSSKQAWVLKLKLWALMATWDLLVCAVSYWLEMVVYALYRCTGDFGKVWDWIELRGLIFMFPAQNRSTGSGGPVATGRPVGDPKPDFRLGTGLPVGGIFRTLVLPNFEIFRVLPWDLSIGKLLVSSLSPGKWFSESLICVTIIVIRASI